MTSLMVYSQNDNDFYAYIKQDFTTSTGKSYYTGSLLPLKAEVCIKSYNDRNLEDNKKAKNQKDGIQVGAVFPISQFDENQSGIVNPKTVDSTKIRFIANNNSLRYEVTGVKLVPIYCIDNDTINNKRESIIIVPKTNVMSTNVDSLTNLIKSAFENYGSYIVVKNNEQFDSAQYALMYGNKQNLFQVLSDTIVFPVEENGLTPSSISFAFSNENKKVFIPNFSLAIDQFPLHIIEKPNPNELGWYKRNDFWVNPLGALVLCVGVVLLLRPIEKKRKVIVEKKSVANYINIVKKMPDQYLTNWNELSLEKRVLVLRSAMDLDFENENAIGTFWKEVDFNNISENNNEKNDDLVSIIAALAYGNESIESEDNNGGKSGKQKKNKSDFQTQDNLSTELVKEMKSQFDKASSELFSKIENANSPIQTQINGLEQCISSIKDQLPDKSGLNQIQGKLSTLESSVNSIKSLVSNTDDKKRITDLSSKLAAKETNEAELKEQLKTANTIINERNTTIQNLNDSIKTLEKQLIIPGSVEIKGLDHFIVFAQNLLNNISDAETKLVRDWMSISDTEVKGRSSYFIANELATRPTKEIERWTSILATIKTKSVITDPEFVKYIKIEDEKERVAYVNKKFVESVVVSAVSSILVLLEQFRTGNEWGHVVADSESYATCIKNIIALCKNEDINVNYCKLYEKLSDYGNVEIEVTVPAPVCDWIDTNRKDIVLYVKKYSVSSKLLNHVEKTSCVVAI